MMQTLVATPADHWSANPCHRHEAALVATTAGAVTCDDFVQAIADVPESLTWPACCRSSVRYSWKRQVGTPRAEGQSDGSSPNLHADLSQPRPPQARLQRGAFVIPCHLGLLTPTAGFAAVLNGDKRWTSPAHAGADRAANRSPFTGITADPVPSILRGQRRWCCICLHRRPATPAPA
jgi:hypothetical protein